MKSPKKKKSKPAVSPTIKKEAESIHRHVVGQKELGGELTWKCVHDIENGIERGSARFDYDQIATALAVGDPETRGGPYDSPMKAMWQRYSHHFATAEKRRNFFSALDAFSRRYLASIIFAHADAALEDCAVHPPDLLWDEALLPRRIVPHLLRQWTRDRTLTRHFLEALFRQFEGFATKGSMGRRAILIAQAATKLGFRPKAQTEFLVMTGDVNLGPHKTDADRKMALERQAGTIGRSIRRLRQDEKRRRAAKRKRIREARARDRKPVPRPQEDRSP